MWLANRKSVALTLSLASVLGCGGDLPPATPVATAPSSAATTTTANVAPVPADAPPKSEPTKGETSAAASSHDHGRFLWFDHWAKDAKTSQSARAFYTGVVGWKFEDEAEGSAIRAADGSRVGTFFVSPQLKGPAMWMGYVSVADVDGVVARAKQGGATVVGEPADVAGIGRVARFADKSGALLGVVKTAGGDPENKIAQYKPGASLQSFYGQWVWRELWARDEKVREDLLGFYSSTVGWSRSEKMKDGQLYQLLMTTDIMRTGIILGPMQGKGEDGRWLPFVFVADADAAAKDVTKFGGRIVMPPRSLGEKVRYSLVADPAGAKVMLTSMKEPKPAPKSASETDGGGH
jgi:predicted enzyme related to lactoylglutathione lyase